MELARLPVYAIQPHGSAFIGRMAGIDARELQGSQCVVRRVLGTHNTLPVCKLYPVLHRIFLSGDPERYSTRAPEDRLQYPVALREAQQQPPEVAYALQEGRSARCRERSQMPRAALARSNSISIEPSSDGARHRA